ncbi:MAG: hypothetical protein QN131_05975 [Armatimonadota bacterium]|nr:hypothetical protein [Armatimonadota bacterium]
MTERYRTTLAVRKSVAKEVRKAAIDADLTVAEWVERALLRALKEQYRGRRHANTASA